MQITTDYVMDERGRVLIRFTKSSGGQSWVQGDKVVAETIEDFRADKRYHGVSVSGAPSVDSIRSLMSSLSPEQIQELLDSSGHGRADDAEDEAVPSSFAFVDELEGGDAEEGDDD